MPAINVILDGDGAWTDLRNQPIIHIGEGSPPIRLAVLHKGMHSGHPAVAIRIDLPDGQTVLAETSARLFCLAAKLIHEKYPNLFEGE